MVAALVIVIGSARAGIFRRVSAWLIASDVLSRRRYARALGLQAAQDRAEERAAVRMRVGNLRVELAEAEAKWHAVDPDSAQAAGVPRVRVVRSA